MSSARRAGRGRGRGSLKSANPSDDEASARRDNRKVRFSNGGRGSELSAPRLNARAAQRPTIAKQRGAPPGGPRGGRPVTNNVRGGTNTSHTPGMDGASYQQRYQTVRKSPHSPSADASRAFFLIDWNSYFTAQLLAQEITGRRARGRDRERSSGRSGQAQNVSRGHQAGGNMSGHVSGVRAVRKDRSEGRVGSRNGADKRGRGARQKMFAI